MVNTKNRKIFFCPLFVIAIIYQSAFFLTTGSKWALNAAFAWQNMSFTLVKQKHLHKANAMNEVSITAELLFFDCVRLSTSCLFASALDCPSQQPTSILSFSPIHPHPASLFFVFFSTVSPIHSSLSPYVLTESCDISVSLSHTHTCTQQLGHMLVTHKYGLKERHY